MPRRSKPFFRKQTQSWYCSIAGKQISLGKDRDAAYDLFHQLMSQPDKIAGEKCSLYTLSQHYLDWCEKNRSLNTYKLHLHYLKSFISSVGKQLKPNRLRPIHVTRWQESMTVNATTKGNAIAIVQRMLNWAVEQDYLDRNPIKGLKKPQPQRRDVYYTPKQWKQIRELASEPLRDLLDFLYSTGCRPQEARAIEARHVYDDLIIFPTEESKGKREPRVIFLVPNAKKIIDRLTDDVTEGPIFRNGRGRPWTKDAISCSLQRISKKLGFRVIAYGARHSWATDALMSGSVDPISVACLMGHKDATMVSRVYSHLTKNPEFLRSQAMKVER
ncbi:tyrosine-type recombinase/integrase [uncultured Rubinisphaera sp.]|uniref:tyrosine-type recombinase/integrase n=1 Tax=uncultured Rubinisphaera sp. TaxID=1678686 RepID=UPI0030DAE38C